MRKEITTLYNFKKAKKCYNNKNNTLNPPNINFLTFLYKVPTYFWGAILFYENDPVTFSFRENRNITQSFLTKAD